MLGSENDLLYLPAFCGYHGKNRRGKSDVEMQQSCGRRRLRCAAVPAVLCNEVAAETPTAAALIVSCWSLWARVELPLRDHEYSDWSKTKDHLIPRMLAR